MLQYPLFYQPGIEDGLITLMPEESRHCIKVLRLGTGDRVNVTDGAGKLYTTRILTPDIRHTVLEIDEVNIQEKNRKFYLHMAVAPTKNISRFEWFLEKATEIGIDEITPIFCENSERTVLKTERLGKILIAAMKQSQSCWLPVMNEPRHFTDLISAPHPPSAFIAYISEVAASSLAETCKKNTDTTILIGPEGDFTLDEVQNAVSNGFKTVSLGKSRLRTETAALVACHTVHVINSK